jgi:hypothetical protein
MIWIRVRDVRAEYARLAAAGFPVVREPAAEPWGLIEMQIEDPVGIRIVLVEVPSGHPCAGTRDQFHRQGDEPCGMRHRRVVSAIAIREILSAA